MHILLIVSTNSLLLHILTTAYCRANWILDTFAHCIVLQSASRLSGNGISLYDIITCEYCMHCILLVLLHGANGHPQELDINQVRIAAASWYCSAVYQICKQYFLVYCNLGQFLYAFHGMRHVPIGITLSFYCVCARITWRSVLIVCPLDCLSEDCNYTICLLAMPLGCNHINWQTGSITQWRKAQWLWDCRKDMIYLMRYIKLSLLINRKISTFIGRPWRFWDYCGKFS